MSDVRRYTYTLESCGSCQAEFVLASAFDALAAENAKLRKALAMLDEHYAERPAKTVTDGRTP